MKNTHILELFAFVLTYFLLMSSTCIAKLPESSMALGGIHLGDDMNLVRKIYGEPTPVRLHAMGMFGVTDYYKYGDSFFITVGDGIIFNIKATANNGIKTLDDIGVGSTSKEVIDAYSTPDSSYYDNNTTLNVFMYRSTRSYYTVLKFVFGHDDKVKEIELYYTD